MQRGSKTNRMLDRYVGIPVLLALSAFRRRRHQPREVNRVGILGSAALGDTLLLSAAIADLRRHFKTQTLILFSTPQNKAASDLIPGIDKHVLYHLTKPMSAAKVIRAEHCDILFDFSGWQRLTAFLAAMSRARFVAGFRRQNQHRHFAYDHVASHTNTRHEVENYRELLRSLEIPVASEPTIAPRPAQLPPECEGRNLAVLHLWPSGARSHLREWPSENWVQLARELKLAIHHPLFVITGSPADRPRSEDFVKQLIAAGCDAFAFTGRDGLSSLCRLLSAARLVVSVNTGVMHLSAILGTPTVSINGPTNNARWGPVGRCVRGVQVSGGGFLDLGFEFEGQPEDCMARTTVEAVLEAALGVLEEAAEQDETSPAGFGTDGA